MNPCHCRVCSLFLHSLDNCINLLLFVTQERMQPPPVDDPRPPCCRGHQIQQQDHLDLAVERQPEDKKRIHDGFKCYEEGVDDPVHHPLNILLDIFGLDRFEAVVGGVEGRQEEPHERVDWPRHLLVFGLSHSNCFASLCLCPPKSFPVSLKSFFEAAHSLFLPPPTFHTGCLCGHFLGQAPFLFCIFLPQTEGEGRFRRREFLEEGSFSSKRRCSG